MMMMQSWCEGATHNWQKVINCSTSLVLHERVADKARFYCHHHRHHLSILFYRYVSSKTHLYYYNSTPATSRRCQNILKAVERYINFNLSLSFPHVALLRIRCIILSLFLRVNQWMKIQHKPVWQVVGETLCSSSSKRVSVCVTVSLINWHVSSVAHH